MGECGRRPPWRCRSPLRARPGRSDVSHQTKAQRHKGPQARQRQRGGRKHETNGGREGGGRRGGIGEVNSAGTTTTSKTTPRVSEQRWPMFNSWSSGKGEAKGREERRRREHLAASDDARRVCQACNAALDHESREGLACRCEQRARKKSTDSHVMLTVIPVYTGKPSAHDRSRALGN